MDGYLNDEDLNQFQISVFGQRLSSEELSSIKDCIKVGCKDGYIPGKGVTEAGFLYLNQLFIQRGRLETTWSVLKFYNFDDSLDFVVDYSLYHGDFAAGIVAQLSNSSVAFLNRLFKRLDKDQDGALSESELQVLFELLPSNPWDSFSFPDDVELNKNGNVTLKGFLGQWSAFALTDPNQTLFTLKYLGYNSSLPLFEHIKAGKLEQFQLRQQRNIFRCVVIGSEGCGKTSLLRSMIQKSFSDCYLPSTDQYACVVAHGRYNNIDKYILVCILLYFISSLKNMDQVMMWKRSWRRMNWTVRW